MYINIYIYISIFMYKLYAARVQLRMGGNNDDPGTCILYIHNVFLPFIKKKSIQYIYIQSSVDHLSYPFKSKKQFKNSPSSHLKQYPV